MQDNIAREKAKAKDKRGAMMALKSKKMLTAELETLGQARLTLEQQIMTLESSPQPGARFRECCGCGGSF